jgi:hypothetical protein
MLHYKWIEKRGREGKMNVQRITHINMLGPAVVNQRVNDRGLLPLGPVVLPPNGNPGIVPPWLQAITPNVVGVNPVDPDVPTIM